MNILIVDDHEMIRRGVRDLLGREYPTAHIQETSEASSTIARLTTEPWDLIVLDINLPGRNGLEVLIEARRLRPNTPVVLLSMCPEEEFAMRAFKLGAAAYLNKASAGDELLTAIRKVLAGGKYVSSAVAETLAERLGCPDTALPHEALSNRELQVLRMIAQGRTIKEIASDLNLSEKTIATYRLRIAEKMHLGTNVEIARYALKHHLVE